jgi:hypothetical protein
MDGEKEMTWYRLLVREYWCGDDGCDMTLMPTQSEYDKTMIGEQT